MRGIKKMYVEAVTAAVVARQDLDLLRTFISDWPEECSVRETLQAIYDIYAADPDLVGIYYNLGRKLESDDFCSQAQKEGAKVLYEIAKKYIEAAEIKARLRR